MNQRSARPAFVTFSFSLMVVITALMVRAADDGLEERLKSPKVWLEMASQDASSIKRQKDDSIGFLAELGIAQCNAGDATGALETATRLLDGAGHAPTKLCGVCDRLVAVSLRIAVGKSAQGKTLLDPLEQEMLGLEAQPGGLKSHFPGDVDESWALENIAIQYARLGEFDRARKLVEQIDLNMTRASARCRLAHQMFIHNRRNDANQLLELSNQQARQMKDGEGDERNRSQIYCEICSELADEGNYDAAFKFADAVTEWNLKMEAMRGLVKTMYRAGQPELSRKMAERVCNVIDARPARQRFVYLDQFAYQMYEAGDVDGARQTAKYGESRATNPYERASSLLLQSEVASRTGNTGELKRLQSAVAAIKAKSGTTRDMRETEAVFAAQADAAAGKFDKVLVIAAPSPDGFGYRDIAIDMAKCGQLTNAIATLEKMRQADWRPLGNRNVAREAVKHCKLVDVYKWITSINDPGVRAHAELGAGEGLNRTHLELEISTPVPFDGVVPIQSN